MDSQCERILIIILRSGCTASEQIQHEQDGQGYILFQRCFQSRPVLRKLTFATGFNMARREGSGRALRPPPSRDSVCERRIQWCFQRQLALRKLTSTPFSMRCVLEWSSLNPPPSGVNMARREGGGRTRTLCARGGFSGLFKVNLRSFQSGFFKVNLRRES